MQSTFPNYGLYADKDLLTAYQEGPARLERAVQSMEDQQFLERPRGPATWSVQEIILHLVDAESLAAFRLGKVLAEPGSDLPLYDAALWSQALRHQDAGYEGRARALRLFRDLRAALLPRFSKENLSGAAFGIHPKYGQVTIRNLLQLYADHSERHIEQIHTVRTLLGIPVHSPSLLATRLY